MGRLGLTCAALAGTCGGLGAASGLSRDRARSDVKFRLGAAGLWRELVLRAAREGLLVDSQAQQRLCPERQRGSRPEELGLEPDSMTRGVTGGSAGPKAQQRASDLKAMINIRDNSQSARTS